MGTHNRIPDGDRPCGQEGAGVADEKETKCPHCGETIDAGAMECRSCGENLETPRAGGSSPTEAVRRSPQSRGPVVDAEVLFEGRESAFTLVRPAAIAALWIVGASVFWAVVGGAMQKTGLKQVVAAASLAIIVVALARCLFVWLAFRNRKYTITSDRIEYEHGVLRKSVRNMDMWRVRDLAHEQTFVESLFGLGRVIILSSDKDAASVVIGPMRPSRQVYDSLKRVHLEADRRRRAVHLE